MTEQATPLREDPRAALDRRAHLDELFGDLTVPTDLPEPIRDEEREARRQRLGASLLAAGQDAFLCESGATFEYLCGARWYLSERLVGLVVMADGSHFYLCPNFEQENARRKTVGAPGPLVPWEEHEYAFAPLASALAERGAERLVCDPRLRSFAYVGMERVLGPGRVSLGDGIVRELRGRKDTHELELLRRANEITQGAIRAVAQRLEPGTSDHLLGEMMQVAQGRLGLENTWVLPLIGAEAANPHGTAHGAILERGSHVLVDTGGSLFGYQSDNTRSWVFDGVPGGEWERAWYGVQDAQKAGFAALVPGAPRAGADRAARRALAKAGFDGGYGSLTHRLGHGIGTEGHEEPNLDGGSEGPLEPGMCFSNEPGIYVPGEFGVRLEDIVTIQEDGADHFGTWQQGPTSPD